MAKSLFAASLMIFLLSRVVAGNAEVLIKSEPAKYLIQKGDTLSSVSRKLGTSSSALRIFNDLQTNQLIAGRTLRYLELNAVDISSESPKDNLSSAEVGVMARSPLYAAGGDLYLMVMTTFDDSGESLTQVFKMEENKWKEVDHLLSTHIKVHMAKGNPVVTDISHDGMDECCFLVEYVDSARDSGIEAICQIPRVSERLLGFSINMHAYSIVSQEEYGLKPLVVSEEEEGRESLPEPHRSFIRKAIFERLEIGFLQVVVDTAGSRVFIDDYDFCNGPTCDDPEPLPVGKFRLEVNKEGCRKWRRQIEVVPGEVTAVRVRMEPLRRKAQLWAKSHPPTAHVRILNSRLAYTPGLLLKPGRYQVELTQEGYEKTNRWVTLVAGQNRKVEVWLPKIQGFREPLRTWREPTTGMEFVWVPGGCLNASNDHEDDIQPERERTEATKGSCTRGFWMGRFEVTNREYWLLDPQHHNKDFEGHTLDGADQPVLFVEYDHAKRFAGWLTERNKGKAQFRLPTDKEWEYACLAGRNTVESRLQIQNNHNDSANTEGGSDGYFASAPVGSFPPNAFGLHDMLGNASEWVQENKRGGATKGGSWLDEAQNVSCSSRMDDFFPTGFRYLRGTGFRLVKMP